MKYEINRKNLVKYMINDDIDGLAEYIEQLIDFVYDEGYEHGFNDAEDKYL